MAVVGVVLIAIGVLFLLLGLARAAKDVFFAGRASAEGGRAGPGSAFDPEKWAKLIGALTEFIKTSPMWFALVIVGAALAAVGAAML